MAYTPAWNSVFGKPLLNQLIAIIQRDQAAALAIVNPALAPITEFHKGPGARTAFPWLLLTANSTQFEAQAAGTRHSTARVALTLDVGQFDQEMAQDNAQDYVRLLDMIITSAGPPPSFVDFTTPLPITHETVPGGITSPSALGSVQDVFVASHTYNVATLAEIQSPVLRVTIEVLFELEEI
ncbi:MAG TPA: hypothetical protein VJV74_15485 [Terriglobia bacterium]|nr:hypothetical protein [Terriglobia bacterium]